MIDKNLASLPRRKTDEAVIIRSQDTETDKARIFKLNATPSDPVLVERYYRNKFLVVIRSHPSVSELMVATNVNIDSVVPAVTYL